MTTSNARTGMGLLSPRPLVRAEGLAAFGVSLLLYARLDAPWLLFLLWPAPDLSLVGFLAGPKIGSALYNLVHTYLGPVILLVVALVLDAPLALALALIWISHIGADRLIGFGLKYPEAFRETHLQRL